MIDRRALTMLELIFAVAILSVFVTAYVAWSSTVMRYTKNAEIDSNSILVDRALNWIARDIEDRVPDSMFLNQQEKKKGENSLNDARLIADAQRSGVMPDEQNTGTETGTEGVDNPVNRGRLDHRVSETKKILDRESINIITPHSQPGEEPGYYKVEYYQRDGSLWRRSHSMKGGARSIVITRGGVSSGDETEMLRNVSHFEIMPVDEEKPKSGVVIILELELEDGTVVSRRRTIRNYP